MDIGSFVRQLTTSQVNRAGRKLRARERGESITDDEANRALGVLIEFRKAHRLPLTKATMGLRSAVTAEGCRVEVTQRLKRGRTMVDKLMREPTMALANMQDIGGCRAILETIDEVRRVQQRLSKRRGRPPERLYDYVLRPRESGYRGVHVIVQYDGRNIEIQLRTRVMHEWAFYVERLSGRLKSDLKSALGPREVLEWLESVSQAMGLEEAGIIVDTPLVERITRLREVASRYLEGRRA